MTSTRCIWNGIEEIRTEIERYTRFSDCHLWKLLMSFYDRTGVDSWAQGIIPFFVTSNAFIGHGYAEMLLGYVNDHASMLSRNEPLYIVELGTGAGQFSHMMLHALHQMEVRI